MKISNGMLVVLIVFFFVAGCFLWFGVVKAQLKDVVSLPIEMREPSSTPAFLQASSIEAQTTFSQNERIIYELQQINARLVSIQYRL